MPDTNNYPVWPGWETVRVIGRGSYGAVYEIQRDVFGHMERAAMKVISVPQSKSEIEELLDLGYSQQSVTSTFKEHLQDILREYALMREMTGHSNIVSCDDVLVVEHDDGLGWDIFIRMELLTPLTKALDPQQPEQQAIRLGKDMCRALMLCKSHDIVHRDIKPANIFVSSSGDYKLGDFGVAKTMEKTSGGTRIGTYEYMAPEVYHDEPYGNAADIYSLGLVLYWLLNDRRGPFLPPASALPTTAEKEQARKRRFDGEPLPPPAHGSEALQRIVLKACAYDPGDRWRSAEDMLAALDALDRSAAAASSEYREDPGGETTISVTQNPKDGSAGSRKPKTGKNRLWIAALAAAVLALVLFVKLKPEPSAPVSTAAPELAASPTAVPTSAPAPEPTAAPTSPPTAEPTPSPTL